MFPDYVSDINDIKKIIKHEANCNALIYTKNKPIVLLEFEF